MPRLSIVPELLTTLVPYLTRHRDRYEAEGERTLPTTPDGKINVVAIVEDLKWPKNWRQHIYKPELVELINEAAAHQKIGAIGMRDQDGDDHAARDQLAAANARAAEYQAKLAEREALILVLRRKITSLEERLSVVVDTGLRMRGGE